MSDSSSPFWPYEQRFEMVTRLPIMLGPSHPCWRQSATLAGATVVREERLPGVHHYVLSMSSLFVFANRVVLLSCAPSGILPAAEFLLDAASASEPSFASLEARGPDGRSRGTWPERTVAAARSWHFGQPIAPPSTKVYLLHDLERACDLAEAESLLRSLRPEFTITGVRFEPDGFSFNAVSANDYITMHYTAGRYASLELSMNSWEHTESLAEGIAALCAPAVRISETLPRPATRP